MTSRTVLITGTSTGIGHAACELFAQRGWNVFAASREPDKLIFQHVAIKPVALNAGDISSIDRLFADLRQNNIILDCIVNNAGYGFLLPFEDTMPPEIEKMFRTNVFGLMEMSRHAARMMREQGHGCIINVSSVFGVMGSPWYAAYSASKWAVEGFSESLAHELRPFNVHVKLVEPAGTKTEFQERAYSLGLQASDMYRERFERKRNSHRKQRGYDSPESIAELIYKAASDDAWLLRYAAPNVKKILRWQRFIGRDGLWRRLTKKI